MVVGVCVLCGSALSISADPPVSGLLHSVKQTFAGCSVSEFGLQNLKTSLEPLEPLLFNVSSKSEESVRQ